MKIFVFEGLPGSGKTALTLELSKNLKFKRVGEVLDDKYHDVGTLKICPAGQEFFIENSLKKH